MDKKDSNEEYDELNDAVKLENWLLISKRSTQSIVVPTTSFASSGSWSPKNFPVEISDIDRNYTFIVLLEYMFNRCLAYIANQYNLSTSSDPIWTEILAELINNGPLSTTIRNILYEVDIEEHILFDLV